MKKVLILFSLLIGISGCNVVDYLSGIDYERSPVMEHQLADSKIAVLMVLEAEMEAIEFSLYNEQALPVSYNYQFSLEQLINQRWYVLPQQPNFTYSPSWMILEGFDWYRDRIVLEDFYKELQPGHYRLVKEIEGDQQQSFYIVAEFDLAANSEE